MTLVMAYLKIYNKQHIGIKKLQSKETLMHNIIWE